MKKYKWLIIAANFIGLLVFFNYSIFKKETILTEGKLALFELAPVDPRSLMQGDYMRLSYAIARESDTEEFNPGELILNQTQTDESISKRGYIVVKLDRLGVAQKVRLQEGKTPLNEGEYLVVYTRTKWDLNIGAESYFFQEGEADKYAEAKYGGLKIDDKGNNVLEGLYDENRKRIE